MQEFYRKGFAAGQAQYEELVKTHASRGQLEALGLTPTAPASASASGGGATTPSSPMASLMPTPEPFGTPVLTGNGSMAGVTMTTGSPTLDIGVFNSPGGTAITGDVDALNDGIDAATAGNTRVVKNIANYGKRLWEFVNGQTTDPGGDLDIKITLDDADVNTGGTITIELLYSTD